MGLVNGLLLIWTNIPSFIVTLGTRQIFRGVVWIVAGGVLFQTTQDLPIYGVFNRRFDLLNDLLGRANFRTATLWLLAVAIIFHLIIIRTRFGNHLFATGGSLGAAMAQGVRTARTKVFTSLGPVKWLHRTEMRQQTRDSLGDIGIEIRSAEEKVGSMSGGERQSIAIGRAIHFGAKLLILDEPTSALSVAETTKVLSYIENAKASGLPVIFITHNVNHIYQVSDSYTIIRQGVKVGTYQKGELSQQDIADLITGKRET